MIHLDLFDDGYHQKCPGWKHQERWWRKMFHRENDKRVRSGLLKKDKPVCESKFHCGY